MALSNVAEFAGSGSACGASSPEEKPSACGSACGASSPEEKPSACGSACGAGDK
ncbi:MAG: ACGX-repeat peptide [Clostridiales bacterium]|nr:ACGX-repeat peptide [Clostridiales bacterium]